MKLKVYTKDGSLSGEADFPEIEVFEGNRGRQALKEVIVAYQANLRQGDASTKTRSEVRGGGRKPWRQKGTGRARVGSIRSPIWVGGGVTFGPQPRDYTKKINKKVKTLAMKRILFDRASAGDIGVLEGFELSEPKTRLVNGLLRKIAPKGRILFVEEKIDSDLRLATRNLAEIDVVDAESVNALKLAGYTTIIVTKGALGRITDRLKGGKA